MLTYCILPPTFSKKIMEIEIMNFMIPRLYCLNFIGNSMSAHRAFVAHSYTYNTYIYKYYKYLYT